MTVVREFHEAFGLPTAEYPRSQDDETIRLRIRLIQEEFREVRTELLALMTADTPARRQPILARLLKELCDLRYVVEGAAVVFGLPIDEAFLEVHASNMSKLAADGRPLIREDGKVLRGPLYREANMEKFVQPIVEGEAECVS